MIRPSDRDGLGDRLVAGRLEAVRKVPRASSVEPVVDMLQFRRFRNTDLPAIVAIWRSRMLQDASATQVTPDVFEQLVLAKPYFDAEGLLVAVEDGRAVGFAHAGFGPSQDFSDVSTETGVICVVVASPDCDRTSVGAGLIERCEAYLKSRGSRVIYGGAARPVAPFYIGLYGKSEPPGVAADDALMSEGLTSRAYEAIDRTVQFVLDLRTYRPIFSGKLARLRRVLTTDVEPDAIPRNWWEACTLGNFELTRLAVSSRTARGVIGLATLRSMDPIFQGSAGRVLGLMDVRVAPQVRRQGVATYLLNEAFKAAAQQGVIRIEAQAPESDEGLCALLASIGMRRSGEGTVYRKQAG